MKSNKHSNILREVSNILVELGIQVTVRQLYYQLVSKQVIENTINSYKNFDRILTKARKEQLIDDSNIVDTSKPILIPSTWININEFLQDVSNAYRKSVWNTQDNHIEIWLEKDALRSVFQPITDKYDVALVIGKGYQSYTNLKETSHRIQENKELNICYFGDFDPTGLDIERNISSTLIELNTKHNIRRIALTKEQIEKYDIPPQPTKVSDTRTAKHKELHGDIAVELDALDPRILTKLIEDTIISFLDINKYNTTKQQEKKEQETIKKLIGDTNGFTDKQ